MSMLSEASFMYNWCNRYMRMVMFDKKVKCAKNEGPLLKMLNSPADGTGVSSPLGFKSLVWPLVEDFINNHHDHANGPGRLSRPPVQVPSGGLIIIYGSEPSFLMIIGIFVFFRKHLNLCGGTLNIFKKVTNGKKWRSNSVNVRVLLLMIWDWI